MADKNKVTKTADTNAQGGTAPQYSEEQILKMMKQDVKRKEYQTSPKAIANRQNYQAKHQAEMKAARNFMANLKTSDPAKYAELMAKASTKTN